MRAHLSQRGEVMMKLTRLLAFAVMFGAALWAQPQEAGYPPDDPQGGADYQGGDTPSRVARLNNVVVPVSFQPSTVDDWTQATVNYPLSTGDRLYTDSGARASMGIGASFIRLD